MQGRLRIKVIVGHCLGGGKNVAVGTILTAPGDLSLDAARAKLRMKYAVELDPSADRVETRDPAVRTRDPGSPATPAGSRGSRSKGGGRRGQSQ